jgi:adenylate kinase family enzyme
MARMDKPLKEFKVTKRGNDDLKKVMIYGIDGSGKSTYAEEYCNEHNLHAIVLDIDDTNWTHQPRVELELKNDLSSYREIIAFTEWVKDTEYDTIILDGVSSLLEHLTSTAKGMACYADRTSRWNSILRNLMNTGKHLIFIGQIDMQVSEESSKAVIRVNSLVNERYRCYTVQEGNNTTFKTKVEKYRTMEEI